MSKKGESAKRELLKIEREIEREMSTNPELQGQAETAQNWRHPMPDAKQGQEWSQEPWTIYEVGMDGDSDEAYARGFQDANGKGISKGEDCERFEKADANRIIQCVNALAGIPDPQAYVAKMQAMARLLTGAFPQTENMGDYDASHFVDHASSIFEAARMAREALK